MCKTRDNFHSNCGLNWVQVGHPCRDYCVAKKTRRNDWKIGQQPQPDNGRRSELDLVVEIIVELEILSPSFTRPGLMRWDETRWDDDDLFWTWMAFQMSGDGMGWLGTIQLFVPLNYSKPIKCRTRWRHEQWKEERSTTITMGRGKRAPIWWSCTLAGRRTTTRRGGGYHRKGEEATGQRTWPLMGHTSVILP